MTSRLRVFPPRYTTAARTDSPTCNTLQPAISDNVPKAVSEISSSQKADIWDLAETISTGTEKWLPPATPDDIHNRLVNAIAKNLAAFTDMGLTRSKDVLRRAAVRYAHRVRTTHFHRTDHYVYWPHEVAVLIGHVREWRSVEVTTETLRRYHEWGRQPTEQEFDAAFGAPSYVYSRNFPRITNSIIDVRIAAGAAGLEMLLEPTPLFADSRRSHPASTEQAIDEPSIARICARLNRHDRRCGPDLKDM